MPTTDQQIDEYRKKYASLFNALEQEKVRLGIVRVESGKLAIHGEAVHPGTRDRVWEHVLRADPSGNEVILDLAAPDDADQTQGTGQNVVNTAGSFSHGGEPHSPEREP